MAQVTKHPTSGIYYCRIAIPEPLREVVGKREWKTSLKTKDLAEARLRFRAESFKCEQALYAAREQLKGSLQVMPADAPRLADRWADKQIKTWSEQPELVEDFLAKVGDALVPLDEFAVHDSSSFDERETMALPLLKAELLSHSLPMPSSDSPSYRALVDEFYRNWSKLCSLARTRYLGDWRSMPSLPSVAEPLVTETVKTRANTPTLSKVFEMWAEDKLQTDKTSGKTVDEFRGVVRRYIELFGDSPVNQVSRARCQEFRTALGKIPIKGDGVRGLTAPEAIAKAEREGLPTASLATVRKHLRAFSAILNFAVQRLDAMDEEPVSASGMLRAIAKAAARTQTRSREDKTYSHSDLKRIFSSPLFTDDWTPPRSDFGKALYWLPLLMAYTGARREELAQLYAKDVEQCPDSGIWYIAIRPSDGQTVKTASSRRRVPLHDDLLQLGFLEYAQGEANSERLFPKLQPHKSNGLGHAVGLAWAKYLADVVGLESEVAPSHGFRHTFKTLCREVGIEAVVADWITGHSSQSVGNDYGQLPLKRMAEDLKRFPSIARAAGLLT